MSGVLLEGQWDSLLFPTNFFDVKVIVERFIEVAGGYSAGFFCLLGLPLTEERVGDNR